MVSKDEIIEKIWNGRIVSDAAIASRIKSARQALGDDGSTQRVIRTVHGQGLRFIAQVRTVASEGDVLWVSSRESEAPSALAGNARPSIAVLPFQLLGSAGPHVAIADALPHDLIASLACLRWLFVIARGSSFRFRDVDFDLAEVGTILNVSYCLSGIVEMLGTAVAVTVELADTRTGGIAVIAHTLNNDPHRAAAWCAEVRSRRTDITQAHFFSSFPFRDGALRRRMSK